MAYEPEMDTLGDPGAEGERHVQWRSIPPAAAFVARVQERFSSPPPRRALGSHSPGDFDLNPGHGPPPGETLTPAAVLIAVVARPEPTVLLTVRTASMSRHAGQIALPGGRIDASDGTAVAAALREAHEEIGLGADYITPLAELETYRTGTGFAVTPVMAIVSPGFSLTLQASEVADAFEVPLAFLMDPANHQRHSRMWNGVERHFYAIAYQNRYIWGVTAGILHNMHERLFTP
jgi:8-oxo-dGTP pyrophosphatase MutT (NUDIX family)